MKDVIRKTPGYVDMHVALAADSWSRGDYITALNVRSPRTFNMQYDFSPLFIYTFHVSQEWSFACDKVSVGCALYKDTNWLRTVRRWPPVLVEKLVQFQAREIPSSLRGDGSGAAQKIAARL